MIIRYTAHLVRYTGRSAPEEQFWDIYVACYVDYNVSIKTYPRQSTLRYPTNDCNQLFG